MNKKTFLLFLPIILALSSCSSPIKQNKMVEDTFAHEEIFGSLADEEVRLFKNQPRKALEDGVTLYKPAIGYQRINNNDGTYSVRFVAAIQSDTDSAVWTRSVHNLAGQVVKEKGYQDVTAVYSSITSDGESVSATSIKAEDDSKPYDCFAVYCLLNIPSSYSDYYVNAYITVTNDEDSISSSIGSINVANDADSRSFSLNGGSRYFSEVNGVIRESDNLDGNHLTYYSADLKQNDKLYAYYLNVDTLVYSRYGYSSLVRSNPDFAQGTNDAISAKYDGTYNIYLNGSNQFSFQKKVYFQGPDWWTNNYAAGGIEGKHNDEYNSFNMDYIEYSDNVHKYSAFMDISYYNEVQFYRQETNRYNHTGFMNFPVDGKNCYTRFSDESGGAWSVFGDAIPTPEASGFTITDFTSPIEIHTDLQKTYLSYQGDYSTMDENAYPDGDLHQSNSNPVTFSFDYTAPNDKTVSLYSVICGKEANLSDGYEVSNGVNKTINFNNPYLGKNYYKLKATFSDNSFEESAIHEFTVDSTAPRNLTIDGMTNCRDLGGRVLEDGGTIKQGLIFRTSGKNQNGSITDATSEEMLNHLKVKTEINIADSSSYNLGSDSRFNGRITTLNLNMDYGGNSRHHFSRNAESLNNFFEAVADSNNYPIFFHCRIGTDRTGLCAIMLSGLLGVPVNEIYQDYLFSNFGKIGEKRYIGEQAGQDNIQNYMNEINYFSGQTFKNKVYNCLLSIGLSRTTLDTVIANLTEGTTAQNNNAGQVIARADQLTANGVSMSYDYSDRNHPDYYYTLNSSYQYLSYTFNTPTSYRGQIVAYLGNSNNSSSMYIDDALSLRLNSYELSIRHVSYAEAGMGNCSGRMNYYPVILGIADISAGENTITLAGSDYTMNVGGIYIFDASKDAAGLGGGEVIGESHFHEFDDGTIVQSPTHTSVGIKVYQCSCGETYEEELPKVPYSWSFVDRVEDEGKTPYEIYQCTDCGVKKIEISATSGTLNGSSTIKSGTPSGFVKLTSTNHSISYTFNYSGTTTTAKIYQRAVMDSWTNSGNRTTTYATNGTSPSGCNFSLVYNNELVDMSETKNIQYQTMLNGGEDVGLGSSYSPMAECLIGTISLENGINTFTYTRLASMNLLVHDYVIMFE